MGKIREDQDKWFKAFRDQMKGYTEPVPEEIWSSLERELNISAKKRNVPVFWRVGIAATIMLAIISSITLFFLHSPVEEYMREVSENSVKPILKEISVPEKDENIIIEDVLPIHSESALSYGRKVKEEIKKEESLSISEEPIEIEDEISEPKEEENTEEMISLKDTVSLKTIQEKDYIYMSSARPNLVRTGKKSTNKWSINMSVNNAGFSDLSNSMEGAVYSEIFASDNLFGWEMDIVQNGYYEDKKSSPSAVRKQIFMNASLDEDMETEYNHKMPISFGATFRYMLSENFAVETGLIYTKLSTEGKLGSSGNYYTDEYKLHYLGIPIKGNWIFWKNDLLSLYASAGGIVEKNIAGKKNVMEVCEGEVVTDKEENFNVKHLQWSLTGALGAQVNVSEHFGVYIEPGIIHYFDDGSSITTIRKKHPTNFNFQLGFRITY